MEPFERYYSEDEAISELCCPESVGRRAEMVVKVMEFEDDQSVTMAARLPNYRRGGGDLCQLNDVLVESQAFVLWISSRVPCVQF